jgi:CubicO group peptidase (beta-lactamase class C family)
MPEIIQKRAEEAIAEKVFPGCVIGVVRKNGERTVRPFGTLTYEADASKVAEDTVYDLASVTKSIPTASLALMLLKKGEFELSDSVKKYLPEMQHNQGATIEDLLMYRVRGVQMARLKNLPAEDIEAHILRHGFDAPSGESKYANLPAYVLGEILERYLGDSLAAISKEHFFIPFGMYDTTFCTAEKARCAPTEVVAGEEVQGIVHDESARVFARAGRAVGHAGLFSTVPDILLFLETLLSGRYPQVFEGAGQGLGWEVDAPWMGSHTTRGTFGKTGFTGTSVLIDSEHGIGLVILSNRTYPTRPANGDAINAFRRDIADIIFG